MGEKTGGQTILQPEQRAEIIINNNNVNVNKQAGLYDTPIDEQDTIPLYKQILIYYG